MCLQYMVEGKWHLLNCKEKLREEKCFITDENKIEIVNKNVLQQKAFSVNISG